MDLIENISEFLSSDTLQWILYGALVYVGILWIALVAWVARDVVSRSKSLLFQTTMIFFNMALPVFGLLVYLILRPPQTLMERYYEEVEHALLMDAVEKTQGEEPAQKSEKKPSKPAKAHRTKS